MLNEMQKKDAYIIALCNGVRGLKYRAVQISAHALDLDRTL